MLVHRFGLVTAGALALLLTSQQASAQQASAQPASHAGHAPAAATDWSGDLPAHFEGITLSAAQKTQIVALQKQYHERMQAMRDSVTAAGGTVEGNAPLTAAIQSVMHAEHAAFKALLDEAGRKRFEENMAKMHAGKAHGAGHGAGHHAPAPAAAGRPPLR